MYHHLPIPPRTLAFIWFILLSLTVNPVFAADKDNLNKGVFIIATDRLKESGFSKSVIYITEHSHGGSWGLIINRPTKIPMTEVVAEIRNAKEPLFFGGPLHVQYIFTLVNVPAEQEMHAITNSISFGAGRDVLLSIEEKFPKATRRTYAGFASWGPGQLEQEIDQGDWALAPGDSQHLFEADPDKLWDELYKKWAGRWI